MLGMTRFSTIILPVAFVIGCNANASPTELQPASGTSPGVSSIPGAAVVSPIIPASPALPQVDDKALRRAYGASDMKVAGCVKVQKDGSIVGDHCPSNVVVFGPYVRAPGNSNVWVSFDIEASDALFVSSDAISQVGQRFHGLMTDQAVAAGEKRRLGYAVHLFEPASALEARIGIRADKPARFTITNLSVRVE